MDDFHLPLDAPTADQRGQSLCGPWVGRTASESAQGLLVTHRRSPFALIAASSSSTLSAAVAAPTVQQILNRLYKQGSAPKLRTYSESGWEVLGRRAVVQALGVLRDRDEWKVHLAPKSPSLSAERLHPTVWKAAQTVWGTGEYKIAAQQAAVSLSAHIKAKAGSHLNERDLVAQVFKPESPTASQHRLHLPGDPKDKNWQSAQQGLHLIAQGAFAGIRNIAVHEETPWTEHEALEHLAVLSVVARWADETDVAVAPEP